jgi:hypothetical protein
MPDLLPAFDVERIRSLPVAEDDPVADDQRRGAIESPRIGVHAPAPAHRRALDFERTIAGLELPQLFAFRIHGMQAVVGEHEDGVVGDGDRAAGYHP